MQNSKGSPTCRLLKRMAYSRWAREPLTLGSHKSLGMALKVRVAQYLGHGEASTLFFVDEHCWTAPRVDTPSCRYRLSSQCPHVHYTMLQRRPEAEQQHVTPRA